MARRSASFYEELSDNTLGTYFRRTPPTARRLLIALALVLGGAIGNLIDRAASGAVTDFLGVFIGSYRWPDFNVADSAISVGLAMPSRSSGARLR